MLMSRFATPEQREIYALKRKIVRLESKVAKLQRELSEGGAASDSVACHTGAPECSQ